MPEKTNKVFQSACRTVGSFKLLHIQRHYRSWQQTAISAEEYVSSHLPQPNTISLSELCEDLNYDVSRKSIQLLKKDGIEVMDTLMGFYLSVADAERMKLLLTASKPLKELFEKNVNLISTVYHNASYTAFCRENEDNPLLFASCCKTGRRDLYYKDIDEPAVSELIETWATYDTENPDAEEPVDMSSEPVMIDIKQVDTETENTQSADEENESDYMGLSQITAELASETGSRFDYKKNSVENRCRDKLNRFIETNEIWEIEPLMAEDVPKIHKGFDTYYFRREDVDALKRHLRLWIATYGFTDKEKLSCLLDSKSEEFPDTVKRLRAYYTNPNRNEKDACAKKTVDYFLYLLPTEAYDLNEDEIQETIIIPFMEETQLVNQTSIARFLYQSRLTKRQYEFASNEKHEIDTTAYPLECFAIMQYISMDREQIEKRDLVSKAAKNKRFAAAWLFVICHFFAAWRSTDIIRLPVPKLPYSADEVLRRVKAGTLTQQEVEDVAIYENALVKSREMRPNKTRSTSNVAQLQLYVPTGQQWVFGMALLIATAHYEINKDELTLVKKVNDIYTLRRFFGDDFADACEGKNFSTRRANKAMLQGISSTSTGGMAYLLPEIARNHKTKYGQMAPTTEVYLQDNNFAGVTPQYVVEQMGKRGFCGFLKQILLETAFGDDYKNLPIKAQTDLITQVGMSASQIDRIEEMTAQAEKTAVSAVSELLSSFDDKQQAARQILMRLIDGKGKGKSGTCVMLAADKPCIDVARQNCIGCPYEILETKIVLILKREMDKAIQKLEDKKVEANPIEVGRQQYLLEEVILPCLTEICATVKDYSSKKELSILLDLAEKGLDDVAG